MSTTFDPLLVSIRRQAYNTLQLLINGDTQSKDIDQNAVALIREAFNELMTEMSSVDVDEESIKSMLNPAEFDAL